MNDVLATIQFVFRTWARERFELLYARELTRDLFPQFISKLLF
jgi:hypothetical protein